MQKSGLKDEQWKERAERAKKLLMRPTRPAAARCVGASAVKKDPVNVAAAAQKMRLDESLRASERRATAAAAQDRSATVRATQLGLCISPPRGRRKTFGIHLLKGNMRIADWWPVDGKLRIGQKVISAESLRAAIEEAARYRDTAETVRTVRNPSIAPALTHDESPPKKKTGRRPRVKSHRPRRTSHMAKGREILASRGRSMAPYRLTADEWAVLAAGAISSGEEVRRLVAKLEEELLGGGTLLIGPSVLHAERIERANAALQIASHLTPSSSSKARQATSARPMPQ